MRRALGAPRAGAPAQPEFLERRADLVVAEQEDVLAVGEEAVLEQGAELAHLVPEDVWDQWSM